VFGVSTCPYLRTKNRFSRIEGEIAVLSTARGALTLSAPVPRNDDIGLNGLVGRIRRNADCHGSFEEGSVVAGCMNKKMRASLRADQGKRKIESPHKDLLFLKQKASDANNNLLVR
jgi:hypothetical protein